MAGTGVVCVFPRAVDHATIPDTVTFRIRIIPIVLHIRNRATGIVVPLVHRVVQNSIVMEGHATLSTSKSRGAFVTYQVVSNLPPYGTLGTCS